MSNRSKCKECRYWFEANHGCYLVPPTENNGSFSTSISRRGDAPACREFRAVEEELTGDESEKVKLEIFEKYSSYYPHGLRDFLKRQSWRGS